MKTTIVLVIDHKKPIENLAKLVEQRAYTIDGVQDANIQPNDIKLAEDREAVCLQHEGVKEDGPRS